MQATLLAVLMTAGLPAMAGQGADRQMIERGRYLVQVSGCNDCHTPGYMENGGNIGVEHWLTGTSLGWQGPWGTTYPANLRLLAGNMTEAQWIIHARRETRPPMPWFNLRAMSDADLKAVYRFLRSMGPKGVAAPAYVPPEQVVATPYLDMTPRNLPQEKRASVR
jgi:mono/diheme cytochrome c family protein